MPAQIGYFDTLKSVAGKVFTYLKTLTLDGTDGTTMTFPGTSASIARTDAGQTFTGVQVMTSPQLAGTVNLSGGQIAFPAAQSASADVNTLDDYEEGTWTIGVTFGGAAAGVTTSANTGYYTKIGNLVHVTGLLLLTNKGSSTGSALIIGLPFPLINNYAAQSSASLWLDSITFANQFGGVSYANGTVINLWEMTEAGAYSALTNADFINTSSIGINATYKTN